MVEIMDALASTSGIAALAFFAVAILVMLVWYFFAKNPYMLFASGLLIIAGAVAMCVATGHLTIEWIATPVDNAVTTATLIG